MNKLSEIVVNHKWAVIITTVLFTIFFAFQLTNIEVDSDIVNSLPQNDPDVKLFREVGDKFGSNELGMIIIESDNVLMPATLHDISLITDTLSETKGITAVTSITNMQMVQVTDDDFEIKDLINDSNRPDNRKEADLLAKKLALNKMVAGNMISEDGTACVIMFSFEEGVKVPIISKKIMDKVDALNLKEKYFFAGAPFMRQYVSKVVKHDMTALIPISFLLISIILFLSFHSLRGFIMPLLTAGLAIVWSMGLFSLLGFKLSMVSNNVPIIVLAVGTAYAIHILNRINHCKEKEYKLSIKKSLSLMIVPVTLSALTTMVGFLSFIFGAYLIMIRDFGLLAAMGTFFSALLALLFIPALMAALPSKRIIINKKGADESLSKMTRYFLNPLSNLVTTHPKRVILFWIIILLVSIGGIFNIHRSVSVAGYFKKDHPVSISEKILSEKFGGTKPVFVVFNGDVQSPEMLKAMMDFENYMKKSPLIGNTQSIADIIKNLNNVINGKDRIPDDESTVGQFWFLLGQQENISHLVSPDMDQALIILKFQDIGEHSTLQLTDYMNKYMSLHQKDQYKIQITGMPFVNKKLSDNLLRSQIVSLLIALVLVVAIVSLMLRSFIKGLYASLPIVVTIGIIYGMMGFTGIPLNIVTVLVASIAMGIGIDYAIHFFSYYNYSLKNGNNTKAAIRESISVSGKAIIINFVSVSVGFLALIFSNLVPMIYFGIIIALSMLGASMGALSLLPSIILVEHRKELKEDQ